MRKKCTSPLSPEPRVKQDKLHEITLHRIAPFLDEGLKSKYVIGSDEFGILLFPQGQYRWTKIGSKEVKSTVKEDRRQYTGDIAHNMDGDVVGVHQIWDVVGVHQIWEEEEESDVVRELLSKHSVWLGM